MMLSVVLVTVVVGGIQGPRTVAWAREKWQWHRILTFERPADLVAYTEVIEEAERLRAKDPQYQSARTFFSDSWYPRPPASWKRPAFVSYPAVPGLPLDSMSTVFLHERRTPLGLQRVVRIGCGPGAFGSRGHELVFAGLSITPETGRPPRGGAAAMLQRHLPPASSARILAGQPDPGNGSHFSIRYEVDGRIGFIDGWLRDDTTKGSGAPDASVYICVRDGPWKADIHNGQVALKVKR